MFRNDIKRASRNNEWSLCIFFSVDIEGATAYKVKKRSTKGDDDWCSLFESFYEDFPSQFLASYSKLQNSVSTSEILEPIQPIIWKFVGDEILFYAPLSDARQTLEHVRAFKQTILDYNNALKIQNVEVRCKGTVWIAGFPINNRILLMQSKPNNESLIDFIGSSIDCGFRLTKFSSSRKLIVSLDLLWMLAQSAITLPTASVFDSIKNNIRYDGQYELKGVFSGRQYPVFWIDMLSAMPVEEKWIPRKEQCEHEDIVKFCCEIADEMSSNDFIKPFISNDNSNLFSDIPEDFINKLQILNTYKKHKKTVRTVQNQSLNNIDIPRGSKGIEEISAE